MSTRQVHAPSCVASSQTNTAVSVGVQVLSLFFVPLVTVHKGRSFRVCSACGWDSRLGE